MSLCTVMKVSVGDVICWMSPNAKNGRSDFKNGVASKLWKGGQWSRGSHKFINEIYIPVESRLESRYLGVGTLLVRVSGLALGNGAAGCTRPGQLSCRRV